MFDDERTVPTDDSLLYPLTARFVLVGFSPFIVAELVIECDCGQESECFERVVTCLN